MTADARGAARLGLVGFRWDESSSFLRGTADAPPLIRSALASESSNQWSECGVELKSGSFAKLVKELEGKMLASD
jgi:arginase family enzyme